MTSCAPVPRSGTDLTLPRGPGRDLVMLAGGTGLAPMKALIAQIEADGGIRRVRLFWGARYHRELYDLPAMADLAERLDWLRLVPCVSDEPSRSGPVESGTVVDVALRAGPWPEQRSTSAARPRWCAAAVRR